MGKDYTAEQLADAIYWEGEYGDWANGGNGDIENLKTIHYPLAMKCLALGVTAHANNLTTPEQIKDAAENSAAVKWLYAEELTVMFWPSIVTIVSDNGDDLSKGATLPAAVAALKTGTK